MALLTCPVCKTPIRACQCTKLTCLDRIQELEQQLRDANERRTNLHKQWREKHEAAKERLNKSMDHQHEQLMNRIRIGNEVKYEVDCENERLREALREAWTAISSGGHGIEKAKVILAQALKGDK